ncbi:MAG: phosphoethanolamine--lipid A transferase [Methylobacillus sp.]|jgi:lipid A ethanolaminephosphotransferase|nr:phosphoethanolamine--lipid A transferase [Methylobacillus sp.]
MRRFTLFTPQSRVVFLAALFIMLTGNRELFERLLEVYPLNLANLPFLISLGLFFTLATMLFMLAVTPGRLGRWVLALLLLAASQAAYYMDQYGVVIDTVMLDNVFATNAQEAAALMSWSLAWRTLLFGLLPAWLAWRYWPKAESPWRELKARLVLALALIIALIAIVAPFTAGYASFIREHKMTRMYANPTFFTWSALSYIGQKFKHPYSGELTQVAQDARKLDPIHHYELAVLVVGETARADRFSLNGYPRETNPLLAREDVVSMTNASSCGTSTGESVPCMFSVMKRAHFDREQAQHIENALDVLFENGVQILWRDNNSDSKGVATRMEYQDFKSPALNPACDDGECRDVGMLAGLDDYITKHKGHDILIVLHQMGNHGPEYYRRYPKEFERFTPACKSSELRDCTREEIDNAYDNAILYTDYFLAQVIAFLKKYDDEYETAMLYVSDHGESLGEHGIYLHAAPYLIAPKEQTHIPAIVWMGKNFDFSSDQLRPYRSYPVSHDDLFCTLLAGYEIDTEMCNGPRNILYENAELRQAARAEVVAASKRRNNNPE